jgi:hypothetical protein
MVVLQLLVLKVGVLGVNGLGVNPSWVDHLGVVRNRVLVGKSRTSAYRQ